MYKFRWNVYEETSELYKKSEKNPKRFPGRDSGRVSDELHGEMNGGALDEICKNFYENLRRNHTKIMKELREEFLQIFHKWIYWAKLFLKEYLDFF